MVKRLTKTSSRTTNVAQKPKITKITKKMVVKNKNVEADLSYMEDDKILKKVEKYVDKNREKTSQEISERKNRRPSKKYQAADLEVMISRISNESKPKEKTKEVSKWILYLIYTIFILAIVVFCIKYFFNSNLSQIS